MREKLAKYVKS